MGRSGDIDSQWVVYHDSAWASLVEQGYVTQIVETRHGIRWALMVWDGRK